jgi:predicted amidohydrolase
MQQRIYIDMQRKREGARKIAMLRKVCIVQCEVGRQLTRDENLLIFKQRPDFVILPEYFNVDPERRDTARNSGWGYERLQYCQTLSDRLRTTIIAGTAISSLAGRFYNTCYVYRRGEFIGSYYKTNPTRNERRHGIVAGNNRELFEIDGVRFSIMICADVLDPTNFTGLQSLEPDIVFIPTTSPYRPAESVRDKFSRDNTIFVAGARNAGSILVKCCAVGTLWGGRLQGRSLVAAPWGILSRISPDEEDRPRILSAVLDLGELREFRRKQEVVRSSGDKDNTC